MERNNVETISGTDSVRPVADGRETKAVKQAVVVFHGMGEQRPMETLRGFVEGIRLPKNNNTHSQPRANSTLSLAVRAKSAFDRVADTVLGKKPKDPEAGYWIIPDGKTGSHELSRIRGKSFVDVHGVKHRTDFYELYYADELTGNSLDQLLGWVKGLLFRWPHQVPEKQIFLWLMLWAIAVFSVVLLGPELANNPLKRIGEMAMAEKGGGGAVAFWTCLVGAVGGIWLAAARARSHIEFHKEDSFQGGLGIGYSFFTAVLLPIVLAVTACFWLPWAKLGPDLEAIGKASADAWAIGIPFIWLFHWPALKLLIAALLYFAIFKFGVPVFGDVARYVRATPASIASREKIRMRGISLLKSIHDAKAKDDEGSEKNEPEYDRIVIVAHSLGSIVALDVLRLFWAQFGPGQMASLNPDEIKALCAVDDHVREADAPKKVFSPAVFADLQRQAATALAIGNSNWRITDFITMGSPLTHADFLIARDRPRFQHMIKERIIPQCPPILETSATTGNQPSFLYRPSVHSKPKPHHAAMFSCVRWTALFDPRYRQFMGDFIGGPLKPHFGEGVVEVPVRIRRTGGLFKRFITHNDYWNPNATGELVRSDGSDHATAGDLGLPTELNAVHKSKTVHIKSLQELIYPKHQ